MSVVIAFKYVTDIELESSSLSGSNVTVGAA